MVNVTPNVVSKRDKASIQNRGGTHPERTRRLSGVFSPVSKVDNDPGDNLVALMHVLQSIDLDSSKAKLNERTISDNNGGRIIL